MSFITRTTLLSPLCLWLSMPLHSAPYVFDYPYHPTQPLMSFHYPHHPTQSLMSLITPTTPLSPLCIFIIHTTPLSPLCLWLPLPPHPAPYVFSLSTTPHSAPYVFDYLYNPTQPLGCFIIRTTPLTPPPTPHPLMSFIHLSLDDESTSFFILQAIGQWDKHTFAFSGRSKTDVLPILLFTSLVE